MWRWSVGGRIRGRAKSVSLITAYCSRRDGGVQPGASSRSCVSRSRKDACGSHGPCERCRFPARFMLIGAMNPCPCGVPGDHSRPCRCSPMQIARYAVAHLGAASRSNGPDGGGRRVAGARIERFCAEGKRRQWYRAGSWQRAAGSCRATACSTHGCRAAACVRGRASSTDARRTFDLALTRLALYGTRPRSRLARCADDRRSGCVRGTVCADHVGEALQFRGE